eukprot:TRINITY_DN4432_c0_g1_i1.p1 TRINITY_DN4432_c0_g1~~TRINITY_DN4432_c0_g1_i1.p1  ORF type:complete len:374 (+),score=143.53 TRINITY_DN4432_c0_g1_i1:33-1124(+)
MAPDTTFERPNIARMHGYTPGEQPSSLDIIKLNTNENPYPPPEPVMAALQAVAAESLRRYPNPDSKPFREVAARLHNVTPDQIILANGGDELLRLLITTFVDPGQPIGMLDPSYSLCPVLADIQDAPVVEVPLAADWSVPPDTAHRMNAAGVRLTFLVSPHAPSGTLISVATLDALASALTGLLLIDEAYVDFVDPALNHSTVELVNKHRNVVVLRSFSKGYSLAGMRCGYGIGPEHLIRPMQQKTKDSYNMNHVAQVVATASLTHRHLAAESWAKVRQERVRVTAALEALGWFVVPSSSNFVLATVPESFHGGAAGTLEALKARNIFVRYFGSVERLKDKLRCTIGTPRENDAFLNALQELK